MQGSKQSSVKMLDIRRDRSGDGLLDMIHQALNPLNGKEKSMPTLLLYDEKGLKLFEKITYLEEYYLTNAEIDVLQTHADSIAARIPAGARLVELGSGNLRKVNILLEAFERAEKAVEYYALDLNLAELNRTFAEIDTAAYKHVSFNALHGTYDDGLEWLAKIENSAKVTCVMSLGSSIGNFTRDEAAEFLARFKRVLTPADMMLVGLDACQDSNRVFHAYNDRQGVTKAFYQNGLDHANRLLGYEAFRHDDWDTEGIYDGQAHRHCASYVALKDIENKTFSVKYGEKLHFEDAYKYSKDESDRLWHNAGIVPQVTYGNANDDYHLHLLSPSRIDFAEKPVEYAASPVPSLEDWQNLWAAWDTVTRSMVPREELMNKPIQLRNNLIFYLGHIPTFADIHFTKATGAKPTDPAYYARIFERGIDPDVDNPELCHDHSEIPDTWPPLGEILEYCHSVRARVVDSIVSGRAFTDRRLGRGLWLAYEHEAMHLETFLYMLLQSDKVLPPPGAKIPDFKSLAIESSQARVPNEWHSVPAADVRLGLHDPENNDGPDRYFGWDNERPTRVVSVKAFQAQGRAISNGDYAHFLESTQCERLPASWTVAKASKVANSVTVTNGTDGINDNSTVLKLPSRPWMEGKAVRTVYGLVPMKYVLDWPVMASYDELAAYARWAGGRIPSLEEARSLYNYVDRGTVQVEKISSTLISAVNGHLCNEGVQETPPSQPSSTGAAGGHVQTPDPNQLFIDLTGRDVAFKSWHPTPVTNKGGRLCGQSDVGGLWEWTSSPLAIYDAFKAMDLYPGYTADFFDGKHNICLGGSWATVPRIAGRTTFVNWYQRNYPYVWCTARLVRDMPEV